MTTRSLALELINGYTFLAEKQRIYDAAKRRFPRKNWIVRRDCDELKRAYKAHFRAYCEAMSNKRLKTMLLQAQDEKSSDDEILVLLNKLVNG